MENNEDFLNDEEITSFIEQVNNKEIDDSIKLIKDSNTAEEVTKKMFNFVIQQLDDILQDELEIKKVRTLMLEKIENEETKLAELQSVYRLLADDRRIRSGIFSDLFRKGKDGSDSVFTKQLAESTETNFLESLSKSDIQKLSLLIEQINSIQDKD